MSLTCTRCENSGFLNLGQIDEAVLKIADESPGFHAFILAWIENHSEHDVQVCDCCGDGEDWYGIPGEHYNSEDPAGHNGPYAYNGGLCECN